MLYVVGETKAFKIKLYRVFETNTGESFSITEEGLKQIIDLNSSLVKNMKVVEGKLKASNWCSRIENENDDAIRYKLLLCSINGDKFKLIDYNERAVYRNRVQLNELIKEDKIPNCTTKDGKYQVEDGYQAAENPQFEEQIAKKYERYEALSNMLLGDASFEYTIEGDCVKLINYTGTAKKIIIPKFVTSLTSWAFIGSEIEELTLEEGLKVIGSRAFAGCEISKITIPKTVEFMALNVFNENRKLLNSDGRYKEDKITILNNKTIILDKIIDEKYK